MRFLQKALVLSAAGLVGLYAFARAVIPPTVYVLVSVTDAEGRPVELPDRWGSTLFMDDGALRPGLSIRGTDDLSSERRPLDIRRWSVQLPGLSRGGSEYASFGCRPGAEAAFAAMDDAGGSDEVLLRLPAVTELIPWTIKRVRLQLPQKSQEPLGELMVTVLDADGTWPDTHPGLSLSSPEGRLPLLYSFGEPFGTENRWDCGPVRHSLPAGRYRVEIDQWFGLTCGNMAPSIDRHLRPDLVVDIKPGKLTQVTLERPRGTRLDLDLSFTGDGGEFAAARADFLEQWEQQAFGHSVLAPHRWRAQATLQRLDSHGVPEDREELYACR
ncbi:hypothetical protein Poly30_45490 [Planctomycetes bacterium Poly30]|uniref:Uncharacterized protein n=1 Tax=Saltatorellus ferox TaxID=2528018 RepID=A0A518EY44_9BACT|nr:hypothetical protein Poly30_45490 [Planctomycetes bacterium Poly30]